MMRGDQSFVVETEKEKQGHDEKDEILEALEAATLRSKQMTSGAAQLQGVDHHRVT